MTTGERQEGLEALDSAASLKLVPFIARHRRALQCAVDVAAWLVAISFATSARYDFQLGEIKFAGVIVFIVVAAAMQIATGSTWGLYNGGWRFGSFEEVAGVAKATFTTTATVFAVNLALPGDQLLPRSVPLAAGVSALVLMAGARYLWRLRIDSRRRPDGQHGWERLLLFGAGEGAAQVIAAMLRDRNGRCVPVAMLDDDPGKRRLRIMGVRVVGTRAALASAAAEHNADALLIAIPSADATLITEITELASAVELPVKILPPVSAILFNALDVADIHEVTAADLLGRHEVTTDLESIVGYLADKRVLVTGAGGSIGSELCRQLYRLAPAELILVDRDESALHAVQLSIEGKALLDSPNLVLLDIRDEPAVRRLMAERRPQVVFHAAALKHLPLLERYPEEAIKTNIAGSLNLINAAIANGVERLVNISTDKAADPTSVLGYSKRIVERLVSHAGAQSTTTCLSVRFGNVLGSRGSVLAAFQAQIELGGPITVTHPEVTRYFMTVEEAVQLVIQAGAIGGSGEALVLDMGEPVRIVDVARLLSARADRPPRIQFTGLRPGEKMHETRLASGETDSRPVHPLISHVLVPPLHPDHISELALDRAAVELVRQLEDICGRPAPAQLASLAWIDGRPSHYGAR